MLGMQATQNYQAQANAYDTGVLTKNVASAPRTIASAISRMDAVNERLGKVHADIDRIANVLGALRAAQTLTKPGDMPSANGAIDRLNDSANAAHSQLSDIEDLLTAISGALG